MTERDFRFVSSWFHRDGDDGFGALRPIGHPCVFDEARPVDLKEAPVMWPGAAFMVHRQIEEAIYNRIQDQALCAEPWPAGTLRVHPDIEDFIGWRGNRAGNGDLGKLHGDFSLFVAKNFSSRSRRSFQNCSYFRIHCVTARM